MDQPTIYFFKVRNICHITRSWVDGMQGKDWIKAAEDYGLGCMRSSCSAALRMCLFKMPLHTKMRYLAQCWQLVPHWQWSQVICQASAPSHWSAWRVEMPSEGSPNLAPGYLWVRTWKQRQNSIILFQLQFTGLDSIQNIWLSRHFDRTEFWLQFQEETTKVSDFPIFKNLQHAIFLNAADIQIFPNIRFHMTDFTTFQNVRFPNFPKCHRF